MKLLITLATPFHLQTNEIIIFPPTVRAHKLREVKFSSKLDSYGWMKSPAPQRGCWLQRIIYKTQARCVANKGTVEQCDWKELKRCNTVQLSSISV